MLRTLQIVCQGIEFSCRYEAFAPALKTKEEIMSNVRVDLSTRFIHELNQLVGLPDFVKSANLDETLHPDDLLPHQYADQQNRTFPCHSPAATWLSCALFAEKQASYSPRQTQKIQHDLDSFVDYWAIREPVNAMLQKRAGLFKASDDHLPDSDFALVWKGDDGTKTRSCRMKTAAEVKAAAEWLLKYRDEFVFNDRQTIAVKIMEKAAEYGADLGVASVAIEKQAGMGICNPGDVAEALKVRAGFGLNEELKSHMKKLAEVVATQPAAALNPGTLTKLASTLDEWDRLNKITGRYSQLLPRPEDLLFGTTFTQVKAAAESAVPLQTGRVYESSAFRKLALDDLRDLFGSEIDVVADGLDVDAEKMAEIAQTMPLGEAEMLERLLDSAGVAPLSDRHRSHAYGLSAI